MNDVGSFPFGVDSNLANPAFPKMKRVYQMIQVQDCKKSLNVKQNLGKMCSSDF